MIHTSGKVDSFIPYSHVFKYSPACQIYGNASATFKVTAKKQLANLFSGHGVYDVQI